MSFENGTGKGGILSAITLIALMLGVTPVFAQMYNGGWVFRSSTDTTEVPCWNDSASYMLFPPGAMSGMMSTFPDSIFCQVDEMPLDSLLVPHDSTFIGWYRLRIGEDSTDFNMMGYSMMGSGNMMQFYKGLDCYFNWDSLMTDSLHMSWEPSGVMGWNGSNWVSLSSVHINGNIASFSTSAVYSAIAFTGKPGTETAITDTRLTAPKGFALRQSYPNPFNPTTTIDYQLPANGHVSLRVYDILGNLVRVLVDGSQSAGTHHVVFDGSRLASGVYFYSLRSGGYTRTMKMILMK